jgi:hypothetical protein
MKKLAGVFKLGLSSIGLIQSAFDFGSAPPLDGGGTLLETGEPKKEKPSAEITPTTSMRERKLSGPWGAA